MLKITVRENGTEQTLLVEGKLAGPWAAELESAWNQARQADRSRRIRVDITGVSIIDPRGEAALTAIIAEGARLIAKGAYSGYIAKQLMRRRRVHPQGSDGAREKASAVQSSQVGTKIVE